MLQSDAKRMLTEKDLAEIEARWADMNRWAERTDPCGDPGTMREQDIISEGSNDVRALLAEVRRLRAERRECHQTPEQRHAAMLAYLAEHGRITSGEYQELVGVVPDTAIRDFRDLMDRGVIEVRGLGRGTHYVMTSTRLQLPKHASDPE